MAAGSGFPIRTLFMLSLLLHIPRYARAQQSVTPNYSNSGGGGDDDSNTPTYGYRATINPSMATAIVVLISSFFFIVFFTIYMRRCGGSRGDSVDVVVTAAALRQKAGLPPELLATFPVLVYSEVKGLKIGKGSLECAVCLSEFEDHETLRLVPKCNHVFHSDCIDAWLADHVTCPVCRSILADEPANPQSPPDTGVAAEHVVVSIDEGTTTDRVEELLELARIGSRRKATESTASRIPPPFPRSHTTGHSLVLPQPGENVERFTLRLPEQIRREIIAAGKIRRSTSIQQLRMRQEWGSRSGYRGGGEEAVSAGRSVRMGRSGRWSAFFGRNFSARVPARESGKRWEEGLGSMKKSASLRAQLGGARLEVADDESCTARLNQV